MYIDWTKHLKDLDDQDRFRRSIQNSKFVLERLKQLLEEKENTIDRSELDPKAFDQPNWAYSQAFKNGQRSMIAYILKLIDLDQQKKEIE